MVERENNMKKNSVNERFFLTKSPKCGERERERERILSRKEELFKTSSFNRERGYNLEYPRDIE